MVAPTALHSATRSAGRTYDQAGWLASVSQGTDDRYFQRDDGRIIADYSQGAATTGLADRKLRPGLPCAQEPASGQPADVRAAEILDKAEAQASEAARLYGRWARHSTARPYLADMPPGQRRAHADDFRTAAFQVVIDTLLDPPDSVSPAEDGPPPWEQVYPLAVGIAHHYWFDPTGQVHDRQRAGHQGIVIQTAPLGRAMRRHGRSLPGCPVTIPAEISRWQQSHRTRGIFAYPSVAGPGLLAPHFPDPPRYSCAAQPSAGQNGRTGRAATRSAARGRRADSTRDSS